MNYIIKNVKTQEQLVEIVGMLETLSDKGGSKDFVYEGKSGTCSVLHYSGMVVVIVW